MTVSSPLNNPGLCPPNPSTTRDLAGRFLRDTVFQRAVKVTALFSAVLSCCCVLAEEKATTVRPIEWRKFKQYPELLAVMTDKDAQDDLRQSARCLLNWARYNAAWMPSAADSVEKDEVEGTGDQRIRPKCHAAYGMAIVLTTGIFDEKLVGVDKKEALFRTVRLIKTVAMAHGNSKMKKANWGYSWQSPLWAALLAQGAWILWDELDAETREKIASIVIREADRKLKYKVPYWSEGNPKDSKAEENSWDSMILFVAVAMLPEHPHVRDWKEKCSELMVGSYCLEEDLKNERRVDGRPVKNWIRGWNVREDGAVINHARLHPDYMVCFYLQIGSFAAQPLAGQEVPEAADFNVPFIYKTLVNQKWESPPYNKPGGAIYIPGKAVLYYPQGTDWSPYFFAAYYCADVYAHLLGWDKDLSSPARDWMRIRIKSLIEMQERHEDRHMYTDKECGKLGQSAEQLWVQKLGEAFLLQWLHAQNAVKRGNWLAPAE